MNAHNDRHEFAAMISEPALGELFAELRGLGDRPMPPVGDALADVFAGATPFASASNRRSRAAKTSLIGLVTVGSMAGGVTAAAAADQLPGPAQRIVSRVVTTLTPLDIPSPDEQGPVEHQTDTNLDDKGDQPRQDGDSGNQGQQGGQTDQPGQDGSQDGDSGNQGQQNGQTDQPGGNTDDSQSHHPSSTGDGADQHHTGGTSGGTGTGNQSGNDSSDSGASGGQQGASGSDQN